MSTITQVWCTLNVIWIYIYWRHFLHNTQHIVPQVSGTLMVSINLHHKVQKRTHWSFSENDSLVLENRATKSKSEKQHKMGFWKRKNKDLINIKCSCEKFFFAPCICPWSFPLKIANKDSTVKSNCFCILLLT